MGFPDRLGRLQQLPMTPFGLPARPPDTGAPVSDVFLGPFVSLVLPVLPDDWSRPAPIHWGHFVDVDDSSEPHILRGLD
ncbi:hypothetical protein GCM10022403_067600 [Streptomyces coacervatus]|uniref:Uncharacterized protein n=1 Tax=Streptomyces coacervatus TaxID=647381 RepID=A0ABP7IRC0_9ACTN|nr:hypothetical protein [Streptomyces coacervatus]MDF2266815.1 hypothetical protein [Streptomyces coacervatus]